MATMVTSKQGRIYYRSPVTHRCGHTVDGPLTATPAGADAAAQQAVAAQCAACRQTPRTPAGSSRASVLHPYPNCPHYTYDEGCPLHGEMCRPAYVGPVRRSRR